MDKRNIFFVSGKLPALLVGATILCALIPDAYFTMTQSVYRPIHTTLEFFSILAAFMIFGVTWYSLVPIRSANIMLLSCAMLSSSMLDFAHMLAYKEIPDFVASASNEESIAFWLTARFTIAATLCVISFKHTISHSRPQSRALLLFGFTLYTLLIYWAVFFHQDALPRMFIEGQGLTQFKIACEWGIISLFAIAAVNFGRQSNSSDPDSLSARFFSVTLIFIISELLFTRYKTSTDVFNALGHFYKIIGYLFLYRAVFVDTIQAPYYEIDQQQTRFRQLFENMTSGGIVFQAIDKGKDFVFLEVNHAMELIEKVDRDKIIGKRMKQFFPNAATNGLLDAVNRVWHTGRAEHFPLNYYHNECIVSCRENYLYRLADGNIVVIYDDITERKLAEQALQESERSFRVIFETSAVGMAETDPLTGRFLRVNLSFCRMTGYSEEELLCKTVSMLAHPDDLESYRDGLQRILSGNDSIDVSEKRYIHKNGREILVQVNKSPLRDENGVVVRILIAIADITERSQMEKQLYATACELEDKQVELEEKQAELKAKNDALQRSQIALQESSNRYMDLFDFAPIGYLTLTVEGLISEINLTGAKLLGLEQNVALHRNISSLFHAKEWERWNLHNQLTLSREDKQSGEFLIQRDDGTVFYALMDCQRRTTLASPAVRVSFTDITERKLLEKQLQQAQKMEVLGQLTGGIAHDFNNILAAVLGYANLALERCVSDPSDKLARYLGEIVSASERARDLIAKMLAYSRTASTEEKAHLNLASEVEKAVALLSAAIPAGIKVVTHIEPNVPAVQIDPIEIQQVLINLGVNSRDAIDDNGCIDITLERDRVNRKVCTICHNIIDTECVALEVKDNGKGIPDDLKQRIFDPFFTTKDIGKGSGLGLSMVQGIIVKNNAHLVLESNVGQGSSFRILFPLEHTKAVASEPAVVAQNEPNAESKHIWVVEDRGFLAAYYLELLHEQGYLVTIFTDPVDALRVFKLDQDQVDLILTDQTMPNMCGTELAEAMLAIKPNLPVVLTTGYSEKIDADKAIGMGIRCFLNKPIDGSKLLEILARELSPV